MLERKNLSALLGEFLGTAILTSVVLAVSQSSIGLPYFVALAAGLTLMIIINVLGEISGGHVNPIITLAIWSMRKIDTLKALLYIVAQFLGALVALQLFIYITGQEMLNIAGESAKTQTLVAEVTGSTVFVLAAAVAFIKKYEGGRLAATIGGGLTVGLLIASVGSNGILNPAVALGINSWGRAYVAGPIIGALVAVIIATIMLSNKPLLQVAGAKKDSNKKPAKAKATSKKKNSKKK